MFPFDLYDPAEEKAAEKVVTESFHQVLWMSGPCTQTCVLLSRRGNGCRSIFLLNGEMICRVMEENGNRTKMKVFVVSFFRFLNLFQR